MKALIFANGKAKNGVMVGRALSDVEGALIIAADGGARLASKLGFSPHIVIGDMDSLSSDELHQLEQDGAKLCRYPPEKDETDLELALIVAAEKGATWIRVLGATGGRFDQTLANVYLLALPQLDNIDIALVAKKQIIRLFRAGQHTIHGAVGDTISLIPVSGDVFGITTHNLQYPLRDETLHFGPARGISNVMQAETAQISVGDGWVLCVHTVGRA
ncbi:MAG: thiamine diphosphokinase [Anaerolineae bacterium]|nr:thiamine diphosphokinase [Anaerolineae bacterium]